MKLVSRDLGKKLRKGMEEDFSEILLKFKFESGMERVIKMLRVSISTQAYTRKGICSVSDSLALFVSLFSISIYVV